MPPGNARPVEPALVGRLAGFTRLFVALILAFCRGMSFRAVARLTGVSPHRVMSDLRQKPYDSRLQVLPIKAVVRLVRSPLKGICAWA